MWRRSGRIEDRARARVDSKAGEAEGRRCGARGAGALTCLSCPCKVEVDQRWPGETPCSKDRGRRAPAGARTHEPRAVLNSFRRIRRRTFSLQLSEFMTTSISWDAR